MSKKIQTTHPMSQRLGYVLKRAQHALRTSMDEQLGPLGLTAPQYNVLSAVQLQPGISNAVLARASFVTAQSMQGIVANLEKSEWMRRRAHPTHRRIRQSELTPKGVQVLARAHKMLVDIESTMTAGFTPQEIEALSFMLRRCAENLHSS